MFILYFLKNPKSLHPISLCITNFCIKDYYQKHPLSNRVKFEKFYTTKAT